MERLAFTVDEAADLLGWSRDGVYDAIAAGHLARVPHTGRRVLIARIELERFAAEGLQPAVAATTSGSPLSAAATAERVSTAPAGGHWGGRHGTGDSNPAVPTRDNAQALADLGAVNNSA